MGFSFDQLRYDAAAQLRSGLYIYRDHQMKIIMYDHHEISVLDNYYSRLDLSSNENNYVRSFNKTSVLDNYYPR
jgi:hypothetical protein